MQRLCFVCFHELLPKSFHGLFALIKSELDETLESMKLVEEDKLKLHSTTHQLQEKLEVGWLLGRAFNLCSAHCFPAFLDDLRQWPLYVFIRDNRQYIGNAMIFPDFEQISKNLTPRS